MKIKYIGPKVVISHLGISFKEGKEDKYNYLLSSFQILKAIKHEYIKDTLYNFNLENNISDTNILEEVLAFKDNSIEINKKIKSFEEFLEIEVKDLKVHHSSLNDIELDIYKKNLLLMKNYRKQRQINKIIYEFLINEIADFIKLNEIKDLETPFNERFWHVLQSIEGSLEEKKITSQLDTKIKNDSMIIYLLISKYAM